MRFCGIWHVTIYKLKKLGVHTYLVNLLAVEVGQANMADQTLVHQLLHCSPRVGDGCVIIAYTAVRIFG